MSANNTVIQKSRYTEGSIGLHVLQLSSVMIFGFLAMTLGSLIELYYIGQIGTSALAAVAFMFPLTMALNAFTRGIGIGASTLIAQAMGQSDQQRTSEIVTHCYLLVTTLTVLMAFALSVLSESVLATLGASGEVLNLSTQYSRIWLLGFPAMGLAMVSNGLIRAYGNPTFPGYIMTIAPVIQVLVGPVLIFGWLGIAPMGLNGAGWAFVMGGLAQLALAAYWYLFKARLVYNSLKHFSANCRQILKVGLPAAATNLIQPVSLGLVTYLLAGFGDEVIAGFGIASRIESVVGMVVIGISTSVVPLVGQNWSAGLVDRVNYSLRICYIGCLAWGATAAMIMWFGADFFVSAINEDAAVMTVAVAFLHIVPLSIGFMGMMTVATHGFNALRRPIPALWLSIARLILVYLPLALIGRALFGYIGVFWATAIANLVLGIISAAWLHRLIATLTSRPDSTTA